MNQLIKEKNYLFSKFNYFLITILPITLLAGSLISNTVILLIGIFFIIDLIQRKNFFLFEDSNFYFLLIIFTYLVLNSFFITENTNSFIRGLGFIRFILLTYAIFFYFHIYKNVFLKYWSIVFIIVSLDIIYEFILGKNILGFSSIYPGRIASFTGEELKIGGFYHGFFLICISFFLKKNKSFYLVSSLFFLMISFLIGEKSNLIKIIISLFILSFFVLDRRTIIKFLSVITLGFLIILIINLNTNLRESSLGRLPLVFQGKYVLHSIYPKLVSDNKIDQKSFKDHISSTRYYAHYVTAYRMTKENIFFGVGLKNFRNESYNEKYHDQKVINHAGGSTHPHQTHFEILSELGIIGYILIISNFIYILFKQRKNENINKYIGISFLITILLPLLPSGSFFTSYGATIFFINYSFLIYSNKITGKSQNDLKS
tara:strand:+ start:604 stop:1893 length:1290 start_codon:yes stop_codon:yes gene_type:complete